MNYSVCIPMIVKSIVTREGGIRVCASDSLSVRRRGPAGLNPNHLRALSVSDTGQGDIKGCPRAAWDENRGAVRKRGVYVVVGVCRSDVQHVKSGGCVLHPPRRL